MALRWAIIGCGDIANKRVAAALRDDVNSDLVAFYSRSLSRAQEMAARFGARRAYHDLAALLADREIDAVYLASPQDRHCAETVAAAQAGKHVLCEKPMAVTLAECQTMIAACRAAGVHLGIAYYRRWYPKARRIKELLDQGAIGRPISARIFIAGTYNPTPGDWKHWRVERSAGGGAMMDVGSHRLDLMCYWLGEPERVAGLTDTLCMGYDVPDMETLICRMRCGCHVTCAAGWSLGNSFDELEIHGTAGSLLATPFDGQRLVLRRDGSETEIDVPPLPPNVHLPLVASFTARVGAGQEPEFGGADGLQASRILSAAYRSVASGAWEKA